MGEIAEPFFYRALSFYVVLYASKNKLKMNLRCSEITYKSFLKLLSKYFDIKLKKKFRVKRKENKTGLDQFQAF